MGGVQDPLLSGLDSQLATLRQIFRPGAPTNERALFRGRTTQLRAVLAAVQELGMHAVVYGERGVGKTSLSYMASSLFQSANSDGFAVRIQCSADDDFCSVWRKFVPRLQQRLDLVDEGLILELQPIVDRTEDIIDFENCSPDTVSRALHLISSRIPLLIVLDEFDRIGDFASTRLFADLVKTLSDDFVPVTLMLVGVADDVDGLIQGHRSVERNLRQIAMPRMAKEELREIVVGGFAAFSERSLVRLACTPPAATAIVRMSQGFPYFTHLLCNAVGTEALTEQDSEIDVSLVITSLYRAMEEASQQIKVSYTDAVTAARSDANFNFTLLACALAITDDLGFFRPTDVSAPLSEVMGVRRTTANFLTHLNRFAAAPSWVLETRGEGRLTRYRFSNPLMRPFVLMKGIQTGDLALPSLDDDTED